MPHDLYVEVQLTDDAAVAMNCSPRDIELAARQALQRAGFHKDGVETHTWYDPVRRIRCWRQYIPESSTVPLTRVLELTDGRP